MPIIRVRGPGPKKVHGHTGKKRGVKPVIEAPLNGDEYTLLAIDELNDKPVYAPVEVGIDNICDVLAVFGMVGIHERRGQGWHRTFIHVPQPGGIPLSIGRVMFEQGRYSHIKWYCNSHGELGPLDFYMLGLTFYIATGVQLDAPAWSDLCDRATTAAQAEYDDKCEQRRLNPKFDRHGRPQRRRALAPRNPVKHAYRILAEYVSDCIGKDFAFLYL